MSRDQGEGVQVIGKEEEKEMLVVKMLEVVVMLAKDEEAGARGRGAKEGMGAVEVVSRDILCRRRHTNSTVVSSTTLPKHTNFVQLETSKLNSYEID